MKIGVSTLSGIRAAEDSLKKAEFIDLLDSMPEGHPLKDEADRVAGEFGGDLAGLPEGHPLIAQLKQAKERYELEVEEETDDAQENTRELKKAKKIDLAKKRRARADSEEEHEKHYREAAVRVNGKIDDMMGAIKGLYEAVSSQEDILNQDPLTRSRMLRLKRMLYAAERGLTESRVNRILNHGR